MSKAPPPVRVSDHAVLRYLERAMGFDIEAVRNKIAERCGPALRAGAFSLKADGGQFHFAGGAVTTYTPVSTHGASNTTQRKLAAKIERVQARP